MWKSEDLIDFKELVKYKNSDIGVFLGCGDSINDIISPGFSNRNDNYFFPT